MPSMFNMFLHRLRPLFHLDRPAVESDDVIRLQHYTVFLLLGIPTMVAFGLYNLWIGHYLLCLFVLASAVGLSVGRYLLERTHHHHRVYRINTLLYAGLLVYMVGLGGVEGSKCLWMYTFPLISFFLLGRTEGVCWSVGILFLAVTIFYLPHGYAYADAFKVRFVLTYLIVSAITYWFEHFRHRYRQEMASRQRLLEEEKRLLNQQVEERLRAEQEKEAVIAQLQQALEEVRTLQGMVPICIHCKKIRDDVGFWQKIEQYIEARTEARFSHGLCPSCAKRLYPDLALWGKDS